MSDPRYDPFEDTGDWPFRDAPHRPEHADEEEGAGEPLSVVLGETAVGAPPESESPSGEGPSDDGLVQRRDPDYESDEPAVEPPADSSTGEQEPVPSPDVAGAPELVDVPDYGEVIEGPEAAAPNLDETPEEPAELVGDGGEGEEAVSVEHAPGAFVVPPGPEVLEGGPHGFRRNVAVVVSRFNGDITSRMLELTLAELRECHVGDDAITVVPVPGAFELPLASLALAKTRRFSCVVALGCVIRGETAHFDLVAGEAASGLQLAGIETGIPVSFGVITCETREQAEERIDRAAEAARTALEMADLFSHVRTRAAG